VAYSYAHPRPALTVDAAVFGFRKALHVLLIRRKNDPYAGKWALPGGFVDMDETVEAAARRELEEETGLRIRARALDQLRVFSTPDRDPRERVVSVAHLGVVRPRQMLARSGDDAAEARWTPVADAKRLAFDHDAILQVALAALRDGATRGTLAFDLLPERFTPRELDALARALFARRPRRARLGGLLVPAGEGRVRFDRSAWRAAGRPELGL
jgi:8-oxo-dGTP diphosphatase